MYMGGKKTNLLFIGIRSEGEISTRKWTLEEIKKKRIHGKFCLLQVENGLFLTQSLSSVRMYWESERLIPV